MTTNRRSNLPPPGSMPPLSAAASQAEISELGNIKPGTRITLKELALIRKVCRDLQESRALLSGAGRPGFIDKAKKLASKWGLVV